MYCSKCGKELLEGAAFCADCGTAVSANTQGIQTQEAGNGKMKLKWLGIAIPVAAVIIAAVTVGLTVYFNGDAYKIRKTISMAGNSYENGDYEEALEYLQNALEQDNTQIDAYLLSANSYLAEGKCMEALQILAEGVQNTGKEELTARDSYVREHIVITEKVAYLDGNIASLFEYDASGNQTKAIYYNADGSMSFWNEFEYDSYGNEIKEIRYNADGNMRFWDEYEYDTSGNKIKEISFWSDGSVWYWYEYEYDASGNEIMYINYNADGSVERWSEYEYDTSGNQTKAIYYNADGGVDGWEEDEYDASGNEIKDIWYDADGSVNFWYEYEYDTSGNQTKAIYYNADGSVRVWYEYGYDASDNLIKVIYYSADGSVNSQHDYKYTYLYTGDL